jgi:hypothetical protein
MGKISARGQVTRYIAIIVGSLNLSFTVAASLHPAAAWSRL